MADFIINQLESCTSFRVDAYCEGYPDVIFEIILDAVPTQEQQDRAMESLSKFFCAYNQFHFLRPIHYVACVNDIMDRKHPRGIYIHMDFGGALEKSDLPIFRVALL